MSKSKVKKSNKQTPKEREEAEIESIDWIDMTYSCPVRGQVTEKVKRIKYKPQRAPSYQSRYDSDMLNEIVSLEDGDVD